MTDTFDAIVVGAGPNGLAAAVTMARAGLAVRVYERAAGIGGGTRTSELTLPGFRHDECSAVHPLALASPFFRAFGLAERIELLTPEISFGHALRDAPAGIAYRDIERTADRLGRDGGAYRQLIGPLAERAQNVAEFAGAPLLPMPRHPLTAARFGLRALEQGTPLWNARFREESAPAMITGVAAHAILPLPSIATAGAGLTLLAHAHAQGWPIPRGGSASIADALVADLVAHGGEVVLDHEVTTLRALPRARAVLLDVTPRALIDIAGNALPSGYRRRLRRFRYGNGVAKVDFALSAPVPWRDPALRDAPTVHIGGTRAEIAQAEGEVSRGRHAERPYVLIAQPSILDDTRAPTGSGVLWAYTHVPAGSDRDERDRIVARIEEFAPGFRDTILAEHSRSAVDVARHDPNYIGGDIASGMPSLRQLATRPVLSRDPWRTPLPGVYLCGASTVPGPGVHGLGGWWAARSALHHEFGMSPPELSPRT